MGRWGATGVSGEFKMKLETMKTATFKILTITCCLLLAFSTHTFAIEGLKVSVRCPDVILRWPSVEGETYIVQYRQTVDTNSSWITLTNYLPADAGTNLTFFVHSNQVQCASGGSGSGGGSSGGPIPQAARANCWLWMSARQ